MSARAVPDAVGRFVQRPLPWLALTLLWAGVFFMSDVSWSRAENERLDARAAVRGHTAPGWNGRGSVPVVYPHPHTGEPVETLVRPKTGARPAPGPVELRVDRDNFTDVRLASERYAVTYRLPLYLPAIVVPLVLFLVRRRHVRRLKSLMAGTGPTYSMLARVSRPKHIGWRWRLHLYALDAKPGTEPVCTIALIGSRPRAARAGPLFPVEVKGLPRPFGRIVVRTRPDGDVLWPTSRALCW